MTAETNNLTRDEARGRASLISGVSYEVALDFTRGAEVFGCETTIRFKATGDETFLDYTAPAVHSVELNGKALKAGSFDGNRIHLEDLSEDNEIRISSDSAYTNTGVGINRFVDPVDDRVYIHSDLEPFDAHRIYPCFDQPDIKGTFEFSVTAPEGWVVISNMTALESPEEGRAGLWKFGVTPRMSTYITAVVAGPYRSVTDEHRGIRLGLWCRESLARYMEADADEIFTITKQGFDFFEESFDYPYPFGGKYDQLFVPDFNPGAMENSGAVTFNERYVFRSKVTDSARERRAETILHEMAHMWFGNLVTMRWWDDLWLNESFATYASVVSAVEATRFKQAWTRFSTGWKGWAYRQDQQPTTHPVVADIPDINATKVNFDAISYAKGASVLRQLVAWVGPEEFDQGIRNYFKRHEFQNTDLEDFLGALEETSGRDLRSWSKQWLETAGVNTLSPEFELKDGKFTSFAIVQTAPEEHLTMRSHRLGLGLYGDDGGKLRRRLMLELDVEGERTEVPKLIGEEFPGLLLLNDGDLAYAKIVLDEDSLDTVTDRLRDVDDSLARAVVWSAAWEMVRDAAMRAGDFVSLVLSNIEAEEAVSLVQNILGHAASAITTYSHPSGRSALRKALADAAYRRLQEEEPGGDLQLSWGNTFIDVARDSDHLDFLQRLLDGDAEVEGFPVDVDRRWTIVKNLVAAGAASEDLISAELERDPTDDGRRRAATARTSGPAIEAKEEAFSAITEDDELSLAMMRALLAGFQDPDHPELLEPFVDRYFEHVPRLWEEREYDVAATFVRGMAPRVIFEDGIIEKIDRFLEKEWPLPIRRPLIETKADLQRAIRAQAFDSS